MTDLASAAIPIRRSHALAPAYAILFVSALVLFAFTMPRSVSVYDEGLILTGASRVLDGALPHRDFYANYGPGQYDIVAASFKLFGSSVAAERVLDLLIKSGVVCLTYSISLSMMGRGAAAMVTAFAALWVAAADAPSYPIWASMLLTLIAVKAVFPGLEGRHATGSLAAAGVCVGAIALFRYDVGFFVCAAVSGVLAAYGWIANRLAGGRMSRMLRLIGPFWIGVAIVDAPVAIGFAVAGVLPDFVFQVITFPSNSYARMRSLPFPLVGGGIGDLWRRPSDLVVYAPPLVVLTALALTVRGRWAGSERIAPSAWTWKLALMASLALALYFKGFVRVSSLHMMLSLVPSFIALGAVAWRLSIERTEPRAKRIAQGLAALSLALTFTTSAFAAKATLGAMKASALAVLHGEVFGSGANSASTGSCFPPAELERARCFVLPDGAAEAIQFIRQNTAATEPIFVGVGRHDKIFINDVAFYFLADRRPATKWYHFDPGLQTSEPIQSRIVDGLARGNVRYVVLYSEFDATEEPNESALSSGVFVLDDYIRNTYEPAATFGYYRILKKKAS
ncbi:MAG TPA: hypothetical protein VGH40_05495 [Roseiarcus sp.]|jgi:hypothetical protein